MTRCSFGWHHWSPWETAWRTPLMATRTVAIQERRCARCNQLDVRPIGGW